MFRFIINVTWLLWQTVRYTAEFRFYFCWLTLI